MDNFIEKAIDNLHKCIKIRKKFPYLNIHPLSTTDFTIHNKLFSPKINFNLLHYNHIDHVLILYEEYLFKSHDIEYFILRNFTSIRVYIKEKYKEGESRSGKLWNVSNWKLPLIFENQDDVNVFIDRDDLVTAEYQRHFIKIMRLLENHEFIYDDLTASKIIKLAEYFNSLNE